MKKTKSTFVVLLVLSLVICFLPQIRVVVKAQNSTVYISTVYIRADGSVEGTNKIQRVGTVYSFTDNIYGSIVVEKDKIVIDGAGYTLQAGEVGELGIKIVERNNITVRNLVIREFMRSGILLIDSDDCNIYQNNITNNHINGIQMTGSSSRNRIAKNHVQNNSLGIEVGAAFPGIDNVISENEILNNHFGMQIKDFLNTNISGNNITSNTWGLGLGIGSGSTARNNIMNNNTYGFRAFNVPAVNVDVGASNTVNGKPVYYLVNQHNLTVPADACYVALIGCSQITVEKLNLLGNFEGIFLGSTTNCTISNNRISNNLNGISFDASSNNTVNGNMITNNEKGIILRGGSLNNSIYANDITANNETGIYMAESESNSIICNNITDSETGIYTEYCGINTIHHNNFINNTKQWADIGFTPWPITLPISISTWDDGEEGNHWSNYNGTDTDGDGIGDTAYILSENNKDNYPLMELVIIPEFPSWIILPLFLAATAFAVAIRKKRLHNSSEAQ